MENFPVAMRIALISGSCAIVLPAGESKIPDHARSQRQGVEYPSRNLCDQHRQTEGDLSGDGAPDRREIRLGHGEQCWGEEEEQIFEFDVEHCGQQQGVVHAANSEFNRHFDHHQFHIPHRILWLDDVVPGTVQSFR